MKYKQMLNILKHYVIGFMFVLPLSLSWASSASAVEWGNGMGPGMMGGFGGFGFIGMIIFWGLIIAGLFFLVKLMTSSMGKRENTEDKPLSILKERYARGEIDHQEFARMKEVI